MSSLNWFAYESCGKFNLFLAVKMMNVMNENKCASFLYHFKSIGKDTAFSSYSPCRMHVIELIENPIK
jgi:hypothetical protein